MFLKSENFSRRHICVSTKTLNPKLSVGAFVCLFVCLFVFLYVRVSVRVCLSVCLSVCMSVCVSGMSVCLSVHIRMLSKPTMFTHIYACASHPHQAFLQKSVSGALNLNEHSAHEGKCCTQSYTETDTHKHKHGCASVMDSLKSQQMLLINCSKEPFSVLYELLL